MAAHEPPPVLESTRRALPRAAGQGAGAGLACTDVPTRYIMSRDLSVEASRYLPFGDSTRSSTCRVRAARSAGLLRGAAGLRGFEAASGRRCFLQSAASRSAREAARPRRGAAPRGAHRERDVVVAALVHVHLRRRRRRHALSPPPPPPAQPADAAAAAARGGPAAPLRGAAAARGGGLP
jgi:hypothetical protein